MDSPRLNLCLGWRNLEKTHPACTGTGDTLAGRRWESLTGIPVQLVKSKLFPSEYSAQDAWKHQEYLRPHYLCTSNVCRTPGSIASLFIKRPSSQPQLTLQPSAAPGEEQVPGRGSRGTMDIVLMLLEGVRIKPIPKLWVIIPVRVLPGFREQNLKVSPISVIQHSGASTEVSELRFPVGTDGLWGGGFGRGHLALPNLTPGEGPAVGLCRTSLPSHPVLLGGFPWNSRMWLLVNKHSAPETPWLVWARGAPPQAISHCQRHRGATTALLRV